MGKDKLPATRDTNNDVARHVDETGRAKQVRDPITGFFHEIGGRAATKALQTSTAEANATVENIDAHSSVVRAIMRMRDTVDDYQARDEKAPEYYSDAVSRHEDNLADNAHKRELATKRRRQEQLDADRGVFNADQGLGKLKSVRTFKEELWSADAYSARTEATIRAAEYRAAETPGPMIDVTPEPPVSPLAALEEEKADLYAKIQEALSGGEDARQLFDDLKAVDRAIDLMKKRTPG